MIVAGFTLLIIIEFIISTSMFWMTEGMGINFLRMQFQHLARWPRFVFSSIPRRIFSTIVPVCLIGSAPVEFLLDHNAWPILLGLLLAIGVGLLILLKVWNIGISNYDSASS